MAKITLEVDDKTGAGFSSFIKNLQNTDQNAELFTATTHELAEAVNVLTQQQAQQAIAINETAVVAVEANRSFMEWSNTLVEFTGNVRAAAGATAEWLGDKAQWVAAKAGVDVTTAALTALAARVIGIGGPLLGIKLGVHAVGAAFDATGKKIVAVEGPASAAAKKLAVEINSGWSTSEEVMERTGKTLEELGLKTESNADRMGQAFERLGNTASTHIGRIYDAFMAPLPFIENAWNAATEEIDTKFGEFARNTIENTEGITDTLNEWMGLNAEHVRQQDEFFKKEERLKEVRAEWKAFEADLEKHIALRRELGEISRIATDEDLQAAIRAEQQKRAELADTENWTQEAKQNHFARMEALANRELALDQEKHEARKQYEREANARSEKEYADHLRHMLNQDEEAAATRKAIRDEELAYAKTLYAARENAELSQKNRTIELMKSRIEREEKDEEKKHAALLELEKQSIINRAAAETEATDDRIEQAKIAARAMEEIRDAELQSKISYEQKAAQVTAEAREKEIALAREKFQTEVDLLRQKLEAEKQLQGGGTQTELGKLAGSFSQEQVREEIVRNRMEAGVRSGRNQDGRKLTEQEIRRMVIREMNSGGVDAKEAQAAQIDLLQKTAVQGAKSGKFSKATATAFHQAATAIERTNAEQERLADEVEQIAKIIKGESDGTARRQAQRRGTRR